MELPQSIHELNVFGETVTDEFEFLEVFTSSPRFADISEAALPIFFVTGFQPEKMKKLYENLIYPTFEARLPEKIDSIENVASQLIQVNNKILKFFIYVYVNLNYIFNYILKHRILFSRKSK